MGNIRLAPNFLVTQFEHRDVRTANGAKNRFSLCNPGHIECFEIYTGSARASRAAVNTRESVTNHDLAAQGSLYVCTLGTSEVLSSRGEYMYLQFRAYPYQLLEASCEVIETWLLGCERFRAAPSRQKRNLNNHTARTGHNLFMHNIWVIYRNPVLHTDPRATARISQLVRGEAIRNTFQQINKTINHTVRAAGPAGPD